MMHVVLNVSKPAEFCFGSTEFAVMPGEGPRTYGGLEDAVQCQAQLALEHGHNINSVPVYKLVLVPDEEVRPLFERALAELKREQEEMFDSD